MIYQLGVFVSRSSLPFLRLKYLYPPSLLQILNLGLLTLHALYSYLPSIYIVFAIIFWEGLLGGAVYVNTFAKVGEEVEEGLCKCRWRGGGIGVGGFRISLQSLYYS